MVKLPRLSGVTGEIKTPETNLWRGVLLVAVQDALGVVYGVSDDRKKRQSEKKQCAAQAVDFFINHPLEFAGICVAAEVTVSRARDSILDAIRVRWGDDPLESIKACPPEQLSKKGLAALSKNSGWNVSAINALVNSRRHGCNIV